MMNLYAYRRKEWWCGDGLFPAMKPDVLRPLATAPHSKPWQKHTDSLRPGSKKATGTIRMMSRIMFDATGRSYIMDSRPDRAFLPSIHARLLLRSAGFTYAGPRILQIRPDLLGGPL